MKFDDLVSMVGSQPLFETGLLLTGSADPNDVRRQLSRWANAGKIHQLRRGLYTLASPYQSIVPHPFVIANALALGSYVSGQSALAYYGMIPEYTPRTTSVTTSRTSQWNGGFVFQHIAPRLFFGYHTVEVSKRQNAFIALPEKSLLDLAHLTPISDSATYFSQLRLQNLERLNLERLQEFAERSGKPKWKRVARLLTALAMTEKNEYEVLP